MVAKMELIVGHAITSLGEIYLFGKEKCNHTRREFGASI
jgi:hypothetical protein